MKKNVAKLVIDDLWAKAKELKTMDTDMQRFWNENPNPVGATSDLMRLMSSSRQAKLLEFEEKLGELVYEIRFKVEEG